MKIHLLLFSVFIFVNSLAIAQNPMRVEIEAKSASADYNIIPIGKEGIILFNETDEKTKGGNKTWQFTKYDTDFKEVWTKDFPVQKSMDFISFDYTDNAVYVLLSEKNTQNKAAGTVIANNYQVLKLNLVSGLIDALNGKLPKNLQYNQLRTMNNQVYFGGRSEPSRSEVCGRVCLTLAGCYIPMFFGSLDIKRLPMLFHSDMANKKTEMMPLNYKGSSNVLDINADKESGSTYVVLSNKPDKKTSNFHLKAYDKNGKAESSVEVKPGGRNELLRGRIANVKGGTKLLLGTYAKPLEKQNFCVKTNRMIQGNSIDMPSSGIYIAGFEGNKQQYIKYYDYSKLKNFWGFLNKRSADKAQAKSTEKSKQGNPLALNYQFLVHDIIEKDDQYIMVAEAYYPEYHTEYYYTADGKVQTRRVFDGFRYTHAVITGFDKQGNLLWDNCFEIWDILTFNLKERVKVMMDGDKAILAYSHKGSIKSKVIDGSKMTDGKESTKIETAYTNDKTKGDYNADMAYWYDNYFVAFGFQKIKNEGGGKGSKGGAEKKKRTVFYFNKIAFQ